jgi:hypothetical protein
MGFQLLGEGNRLDRLVPASEEPKPGSGNLDKSPMDPVLTQMLPTRTLPCFPVFGNGIYLLKG